MTPQAERTSIVRSESGQAAVLVALLMFFIFMAFAALAIDGAMTYTVRRNLQNVADASALAACRVISNGGTPETALTEAKNTISNNGLTPPPSNVGSGTGLIQGIEVSTSDVRVAIQRQVPTVLTQFFGRAPSNMIAQAHCDSRAGGGLMPIAVRRWDAFHSARTDFVAKLNAPPYPSDSITVTWSPGRYGPYALPVPCGNPDAPACAGGANYVASDSAVPGVPDSNSGPAIEILGQGALPNTGKNSYNNFVMPDIRNIAAGAPNLEYYNGATGNPNTDKDISQQYIYSGYPGPFFLPGEQMSILDGASANFEAHSVIDAGYRVGDAVAVMVYDGNVWDTPDYAVNIVPKSNNGIAASVRPSDTATAVAYTVSIVKSGHVNWSTSLNFSLGFKLSEPSLCGPGLQMGIKVGSNPITALTPTSSIYSYSTSSDSPGGVTQSSGWTGTLYVWTTDPTTTVASCVSGLNLVSVSSLGLDRGTSSHFGFTANELPASYYTVRSGDSPSSGSGILSIPQGQSAKPTHNLITFGFGNSSDCKNVPVSAEVYLPDGVTLQPWTSYFPAAEQATTIDIKKNADNNPPTNYSLDALVSASIGTYILRFTVMPPHSCSGLFQRSLDLPLKIVPPPGGTSTPTNFVVFQGYAIFRISGFTPNANNPNTVWGYAISPLYQSLSDITFGLQPRLVPWY